MRKMVMIVILGVALILPCICAGQSDVLTYTPPAKEKKVIDTTFITVSSYLVLTTIFDIETTFAAIRNSGGREANPLMRPFIKSGRPATYAIELGIDAVVIFIAYEIKKSKKIDLAKTWWVSPMILGTTHGVCGGLNLRYVW